MSVQSQMVSLYKKEVVPQYEFEKGTWWRDGFWRYARFKNIRSHVRGGGGVVISGILRYIIIAFVRSDY